MSNDIEQRVIQFKSLEAASKDTLDFKKIYVDMAGGDLIAGLALSEIVYWNLDSKTTGETRLRVRKDGVLWLAVSRNDWWNRIRLGPRQADHALEVLAKLGIIEKTIHRFNSAPTCHVRIMWEKFLDLYDYYLVHTVENPFSRKREIGNHENVKSPNGEIGNHENVKSISPNGEIGNPESVRTLTETTTPTTTQTTSETTCAAGAAASEPPKQTKPIDPIWEALVALNGLAGVASSDISKPKRGELNQYVRQMKDIAQKTGRSEQEVAGILLLFPAWHRIAFDFSYKNKPDENRAFAPGYVVKCWSELVKYIADNGADRLTSSSGQNNGGASHGQGGTGPTGGQDHSGKEATAGTTPAGGGNLERLVESRRRDRAAARPSQSGGAPEDVPALREAVNP